MKIEIELFHIILFFSPSLTHTFEKLKRVDALIAQVFLYRFRLHFNRVQRAYCILQTNVVVVAGKIKNGASLHVR